MTKFKDYLQQLEEQFSCMPKLAPLPTLPHPPFHSKALSFISKQIHCTWMTYLKKFQCFHELTDILAVLGNIG